jgi:hypothetical protein
MIFLECLADLFSLKIQFLAKQRIRWCVIELKSLSLNFLIFCVAFWFLPFSWRGLCLRFSFANCGGRGLKGNKIAIKVALDRSDEIVLFVEALIASKVLFDNISNCAAFSISFFSVADFPLQAPFDLGDRRWTQQQLRLADIDLGMERKRGGKEGQPRLRREQRRLT